MGTQHTQGHPALIINDKLSRTVGDHIDGGVADQRLCPERENLHWEHDTENDDHLIINPVKRGGILDPEGKHADAHFQEGIDQYAQNQGEKQERQTV